MIKLKNVSFMSRNDAELLTPTTNDAIISISSSEDSVILNTAWAPTRVLKLTFDDVDENGYFMLGNCERVLKVGAITFSANDARKIFEFVDAHKDHVQNLYVHCLAGISRSSAIAKFIADVYGLKFPHEYKLYNRFIYRVMHNTYDKLTYGN